jgi:hypothetical protein
VCVFIFQILDTLDEDSKRSIAGKEDILAWLLHRMLGELAASHVDECP